MFNHVIVKNIRYDTKKREGYHDSDAGADPGSAKFLSG